MNDHNTAILLGTEAALDILDVLKEQEKFKDCCQLCLVRGIATTLLAVILLENDLDDADVEVYMENFASSVIKTHSHAKKEADQEDPPQSPDKRTLN